ncbi:hypothetical protein H5410_020230 [Solanum commersonii]|uniref:Uncharacterized protein n=1 Tax=Solanum commersonii TaxID=4109 RepID=A0A9J5Z9I4_SOLCO|nr:hypothetical protein H5410_020230 [Solanum commersonii]
MKRRDAAVSRCDRLVIKGTRRDKGRPRKYWGEVIRQDMTQLHITEDMTHLLITKPHEKAQIHPFPKDLMKLYSTQTF